MKRSRKRTLSKRNNNSWQSIARYISEAGMLKRQVRSGWQVVGVANPESVAEHSFRAAILAYVLACMEGIAPERVMAMALFHDMHEARISDLHSLAKKYVDLQDAEDRAFDDQIQGLPGQVSVRLKSLRFEESGRTSREARIVRDADILECLMQAREYYDNGHVSARRFLRNALQDLKTPSAKKLWRTIEKHPTDQWWAGEKYGR